MLQPPGSPAAPQQEAREAAWQGADGTWGDGHTAEPSFVLHCNRKRTGTDIWVDGFVLVSAVFLGEMHQTSICLPADGDGEAGPPVGI